MTVVETERLIVREWRDDDRAAFAALNGDPDVMLHFPATLTRAESDAVIELIRLQQTRNGFCFWALELKETSAFIGLAGLNIPLFDAPFMPAVEIGWRLAKRHWGRGYATEAAAAIVTHGFTALGLDEIVSFTAEINMRSRAVMERVGMRHDREGDFDHPKLSPGHRLSRHVLYRLPRPNTCMNGYNYFP